MNKHHLSVVAARCRWYRAALTAFVLALVGAQGTAAQTPVRDVQAAGDPIGVFSLSGLVMDPDHAPIRRATVVVDGEMHLTRTTTTDDAGRFAVGDLPAGRFTVTASKGGYPSMSYGAHHANRPGAGILVGDKEPAQTITVTLTRGAVITGTVLDDHGQPMPDIDLLAWEVRTSLTGERTLGQGYSLVESDDQGAYRLFGLPQGDYVVGTAPFFSAYEFRVPTDTEIRDAFAAAQQPGTPRPSGTPAAPQRYSYARTFFPDAVDPLVATIVSVGPAEVREGVDLHMKLVQAARVEGIVLLASGAPAPNVLVTVSRPNAPAGSGGNAVKTARTSPDGRFTIQSLSPGAYRVLVQTLQGGGAPGWAQADVSIGATEVSPLSLTLQPALTFSGRLVFDGTTAPPDPTKVQLFLQPLDKAQPPGLAPTSPSGTFMIQSLTPGRYRLEARIGSSAPDPGWGLSSVVLGGQDVTDRAIEIGPADSPLATVTFTDRVSELSGTLTPPPGANASDFFVVILPADRAFWVQGTRRIQRTRPGVDARYHFVGLPPGDYRIAATTDLEDQDLQDLGALSQLASQSVAVQIGPGDKKTFDLKLGGGSRP